MPYVWGAAGPTSFDCSGLVQWSFAQAGVVMPRVAADQARTGPSVPMSQLQPGDLLFYHIDPTAPGYISHVAIYLGEGLMIQAPQPGKNVEVVPVDLGSRVRRRGGRIAGGSAAQVRRLLRSDIAPRPGWLRQPDCPGRGAQRCGQPRPREMSGHGPVWSVLSSDGCSLVRHRRTRRVGRSY